MSKSKTTKKTAASAPKAAKKQPAGQTASKKGTAAKKKTTAPAKKKSAPRPAPEPEKKPIFRKKTIAQRTVAFKTRNWAAVFCWTGVVLFSLLAVFFYTCVVGYSFSGLVCLGLAAICLFYALIPHLRSSHPLTARRLKRVFTVILCLGLLVCGATEAVIVRASFGTPHETCDYLVVLGAGVRGSVPSLSLQNRIDAAFDYLNAHPETTAILSGGQGEGENLTEAACMYRELTAMGIDPSRLWQEEQATSTWENLNFSLNMIEERTGTRPAQIGVLSSEYHLFRASLFAKQCGVAFIGVPARTTKISLRINYFMREVAGVWHYLLLGGQYQS